MDQAADESRLRLISTDREILRPLAEALGIIYPAPNLSLDSVKETGSITDDASLRMRTVKKSRRGKGMKEGVEKGDCREHS